MKRIEWKESTKKKRKSKEAPKIEQVSCHVYACLPLLHRRLTAGFCFRINAFIIYSNEAKRNKNLTCSPHVTGSVARLTQAHNDRRILHTCQRNRYIEEILPVTFTHIVYNSFFSHFIFFSFFWFQGLPLFNSFIIYLFNLFIHILFLLLFYIL